MALSLYDVSVPVFIRGFDNLAAILNKGRAHAASTGMSESDLLEARLFPDMGNLITQIQRASDTAKFAAVRVGQVEGPAMADEETTFDDLQARIAKTVDFLKSVPSSAFDGREGAQVELKNRGGSRMFTAEDYLLTFALPNFFFHVTTAYALLRHKGVPVGKADYLWGG
ncbi:DUF1993 domain-containing protein [Rhizobium sp. RU36D]|uniref:DUF1993 domain-containing protein n=1 Tax=Rhizobium sp. RU36D TaxID=1907415 RepID=UPI0009D883A4|nr:DUF1993 domain-containing protein [Rhizobium sp. RU36D]SMC91629.1 hypothetical protein SAMN05880593_11068 [Rhizobium sp. RU36D]